MFFQNLPERPEKLQLQISIERLAKIKYSRENNELFATKQNKETEQKLQNINK